MIKCTVMKDRTPEHLMFCHWQFLDDQVMAGLQILRYYDFNDGDDVANRLVMSDIHGDDDDDDDIRGDGVGVGA